MQRRILSYIINDLQEKIVLLAGPRQVGKTTLATSISNNATYLNYDLLEHRRIITQMSWPKDTDLLILDELHKMPNWKRFLKGIYDVNKHSSSKKNGNNLQKIIVTGSARLDIAKSMGDSLAGRHFSYTLNPLTLQELVSSGDNSHYSKLLEFSGFPEPYFKENQSFYRKWQSSHLDLILRQDLIDLEQVRNITQIELLVELLRTRIASPCSYSSLAEDLQTSPATVKNWLKILEHLYVIFRITPYHKNVARSLLKTPKFYFYDVGRVQKEGGARFENLVALALKSEIDFQRDTQGRKLNMHYLRDRNGNEIDFLITEDEQPLLAVEAKTDEDKPDKSFKTFFDNKKLHCKESRIFLWC
jgi:uncharacterized protein